MGIGSERSKYGKACTLDQRSQVAYTRPRSVHVEERRIVFVRSRTACVEKRFEPQADETRDGGYIYDFDSPVNGVMRIDVWFVKEQAIYEEKVHFKNTDFTRGLNHLKRILLRDVSSNIRFEVYYKGVLPLQPLRNRRLTELHAVQDELNAREVS